MWRSWSDSFWGDGQLVLDHFGDTFSGDETEAGWNGGGLEAANVRTRSVLTFALEHGKRRRAQADLREEEQGRGNRKGQKDTPQGQAVLPTNSRVTQC